MSIKRNFPTLLVSFLIVVNNSSQAQIAVKGKVLNSKNEPAVNASVLLLQLQDSSLVNSIICDVNGEFIFKNIALGNYILLTSLAGHQQIYSVANVSRGGDTLLETIVLKAAFTELKEVAVIAKKPFLEQQADRLVVNVAGSLTAAGNTALQILERSPGIVVNRQNNTIAMLGKEGVNIMINGKPSYLPASAILQMLDAMNGESIEKIELITSPSASLDAEGRAGYINVILKQNENAGTNGSFYGTAGYGKGLVMQAGLNFNHRSNKMNVYGNFSYSRLKNPFTGRTYNRVSNSGDIYETVVGLDRIEITPRHNARLAMDYQLSRRTVAGILLTSSGRWYRQEERTAAAFNVNGFLDTLAVNVNKELNNWQDYGVNINLQQNFKKGDILSFNAYYLRYQNNQPFSYYSRYYDKADRFIYDETSRNSKRTPLNFWIAALDYSGKLSRKINLEAGVKGTLANFTNQLSFERLLQGNWIEDLLLSSTYLLKENYSAVYASLNTALNEKTTVKGGFRYEYTNSNLQADRKNVVDRHYGKLFPVFHITYRINEKNTVSFSYNSRITRPSFNDLAPFIYYSNRNSLLTGNPALQPSISHAITAAYNFKKYFLQLSFTNERNTITFFQPAVDSVSNKIINKPENLDNQKLLTVVLSIPARIAKWWNIQYNITGTWQQVNAWYEKEPVRIEQGTISFNMTQSFTLPKHFSLELAGFYNSRNLNGITVFKAIGSLDLGVRKKLSARDQVNVSANNLFNSMDLRVYTNLPEKNLTGDVHLRHSWRTFKITYTRNFGKERLRPTRSRTTGAEEEKGRVQY